MATSTIKTVMDYETGALTKAISNITAFEFASYFKVGRVCVVRLNFTVGTTISNSTATLFTGAPAPVAFIRTTLFRVNAKGTDHARVEIADPNGTGGVIRNAYTSGGITAGQYKGEIVYITAE